MYTAVANRYAITRWDANRHRQYIITRSYRPIPLSEEEIEAAVDPIVENLRANLPANLPHLFARRTIQMAIEKAEFPVSKHPIGGLAVMSDGTLVVTHDLNLSRQIMSLDLFDSRGQFIGQGHLPIQGVASLNLLFKGQYLYRMETDEEGDTRLIRYRCQRIPNTD